MRPMSDWVSSLSVAWRKWLKQAATNTVADTDNFQAVRFRVAIKDAIQPMTELIADMTTMDDEARKAQLRTVAAQSTGALTLLLKDVWRLRATVYKISEEGGECISYNGRGDNPTPFKTNDPRGQAALRLVKRGGEPLFVRDIDDKNDTGMADFHGTGDGYKTFVTGAIGTKQGERYGMISIDAPRPPLQPCRAQSRAGLGGNPFSRPAVL